MVLKAQYLDAGHCTICNTKELRSRLEVARISRRISEPR
jgi:hypothetical protein